MFRAFSVGLPRSLCSLAMTTKKKYVILSVSEISHRKSDNVYFRKIFFSKCVKTIDKGILCVV